MDGFEGQSGLELKSIPPAYRKVVQRVIQREMNVQFCILQEEMRQDLQHIRSDALVWFQDVDDDLRGIRGEMQDCLAKVQSWSKSHTVEKPRSAPPGARDTMPIRRSLASSSGSDRCTAGASLHQQ